MTSEVFQYPEKETTNREVAEQELDLKQHCVTFTEQQRPLQSHVQSHSLNRKTTELDITHQPQLHEAEELQL